MITKTSGDVPRHPSPRLFTTGARTKSNGARHARTAIKTFGRAKDRCQGPPGWVTSLCATMSIWQCQELVSKGESNLRIQFLDGTAAEGNFQYWHLRFDRTDGKFRAEIVIWDKEKNYEYVTSCDALQIASVTSALP